MSIHPSIPPISALKFLIGEELSLISFGTHVTFHWWDSGNIQAYGYFDHVDEHGQVHEFGDGYPPSVLHHLLRKKVTSLSGGQDNLTLIFDDGQSLRFYVAPNLPENVLIQLGKDLQDGWEVF